MPDFCEYHTQFATDVAVIKNTLEMIKDKMCTHIREGEEQGGFRDRIIIVEQEIKVIKKGYWRTAIVAGILGGLVGNLSPDVITGMARLIGLIK